MPSFLQKEPEADFFVAQDGDDGWSGTRSSATRARDDGPFATLERAQQAVRALGADGLDHDVRVLVRAGRYLVCQGLEFGPADSGTEAHSVTWAAYPEEQVTIVGGERITGWESYRDGISKVAMLAGSAVRQLYENGRRMRIARLPKQGYFRTLSAVDGYKQNKFVYRAPDFDPSEWDISDAYVYIWPGHDWFAWDKPIRGIDAGERIVTTTSNPGYAMIGGERYMVKNVLALLTEPGECQVSASKRMLYARPSLGDIADAEIVAATSRHVVSIHGDAPTRPVRNLHFEGLDFSISDRAVVSLTGAVGCSFRFCTLENGGDMGLHITGYAQENRAYGCLIRYNGHDGVFLEGAPQSAKRDVNHHNVIENCHIHHCGELVGHGAGVDINQSGHNQILHNHIHHMPRYGTTIKGLRRHALMDQMPEVTETNWYDYTHSRNNLIAYNDIHHVNQDSQDTGAMESWGPGRDNVYDHNLVHDVGNAEFNLQSGLYLDDASDYFTVTNNIIWNVVGTGSNQPIFAKGIHNTFENNILVLDKYTLRGIASMAMADEPCNNHIYRRNIIYMDATVGTGGYAYQFVTVSRERIAEANHNVFWRDEGTVFFPGSSRALTLEGWQRLGGPAHDLDSVVADPLFVDVANHDFRLAENSPALALGFEPIDMAQIGLKADFPARLERD